ncbi:polysaccharide pyruvyl transferase WcaK-like protein [Paenibacillus favisporus]|uniref:Polysaccharide pyruvyl transferase WcaK-like protein n=1 Tax=Paenibacillus favisporus TaxID=221028 RepID=A0ABV2F2S1_9BACL
MNIGVCGYYGMGNFGDDLFLRTLQQVFEGHVVYPWTSRLDPAQTDHVIIGGGDLITPYSFNPYYFPDALKNHPKWLYGVGIVDNYPESSWPADQVAKYRNYIRTAQMAVFRDSRSADIAQRAGFHQHVQQAHDIVFAYRQPDYPVKRFSSRPTIGLCLFAYPSFPFENMLQLSLHLIRQGYHLVFIPVINHPTNIYSDLTVCQQILNRIKEALPGASAETLPMLMELDLTYSYIQSVDYLITYKLHPALVALRAGKPVFALSQMRKVESLLDAFGMKKYYCDYKLPYEDLQNRVDAFLKESPREIKLQEKAIRRAERESLHQLRRLKEEIESYRS